MKTKRWSAADTVSVLARELKEQCKGSGRTRVAGTAVLDFDVLASNAENVFVPSAVPVELIRFTVE